MIAQELYEGIDIEGEGTVGLISYIRTDSKRIYDDVYRRYLQPCIRYIEEGAYEACKNLYIEMTEKLDKEK